MEWMRIIKVLMIIFAAMCDEFDCLDKKKQDPPDADGD